MLPRHLRNLWEENYSYFYINFVHYLIGGGVFFLGELTVSTELSEEEEKELKGGGGVINSANETKALSLLGGSCPNGGG